jgi:hypothetical protein
MKPLTHHRIARCQRALTLYDSAYELEYCLVDLLTDARHWCDRNGHSFLELDRRAFRAYRDEIESVHGRRL